MSVYLSIMPKFEGKAISLECKPFCMVVGRKGGTGILYSYLRDQEIYLSKAIPSEGVCEHLELDDSDSSLSRQHALLGSDGKDFFLHPWVGTDSEINPLRLNNQPLTVWQWVKLTEGDLIEMGSVRVIFRVSSASEKSEIEPPTERLSPNHQSLRAHTRHTLAFLGEGLEKLFLCAEGYAKAKELEKEKVRRKLLKETLALFSSTFRAKETSFFFCEKISDEQAAWKELAQEDLHLEENAAHHLSLAWSRAGKLVFALVLEGSLSDGGAFDEFDQLLFLWLAEFVKKIWIKIFPDLDEYSSHKSAVLGVSAFLQFFLLPSETEAEEKVTAYVLNQRLKNGEAAVDLIARMARLGFGDKRVLIDFQMVLRELAGYSSYTEASKVLGVTNDTITNWINEFAALMGIDKRDFQHFMRDHVRGRG